MIPLSFYQNPDVLSVAKELLGKMLMTNVDGHITGGIITECEAYAGVNDRASHAYNNLRTKRNEAMYKEGGFAYVYLCYGMHHLFNIVTGEKDVPHTILIRAIKPMIGLSSMAKRRNNKPLANGPGTLSQALGITLKLNHHSLCSDKIWLEEGIDVQHFETLPRIGVDYAKEDALLPYRFLFKPKLPPQISSIKAALSTYCD